MDHFVTREMRGISIVEFKTQRLIDELEVFEIGNSLTEFIEDLSVDKLLLNFCNVKFMASTMLSKITDLRKKCIERKIDLRVCSLNENPREVFELMKLDQVFEIYEDEKLALNGFELHSKRWYV